jgi:hypothetical protein
MYNFHTFKWIKARNIKLFNKIKYLSALLDSTIFQLQKEKKYVICETHD